MRKTLALGGERKSGMARDFTWLYNMVKRIPKGSVASYGQLALLAGKPGWARQVGRGMAACMDTAVPCHRVVRGDGSLPCAFGIGGPAQQRALLEGEGVGFLPDGRVGYGPAQMAELTPACCAPISGCEVNI